MTQTGTASPATAALGQCVRCSKVYRASTYSGATYAGKCEECRIGDWAPSIRWSRVRGTVSATECDSACTSAKGTKCSCTCGGDRHGAAHALAF